MKKLDLIFLHGFTSSISSRKGNYLAEWVGGMPTAQWHAIDFNPGPADFEYMSITGMIDRLRQFCLMKRIERPYLIGNSLGGMIAIQYAHRYGAAKMALLAPALGYGRFGMPDEAVRLWQEQGYFEFDHPGFKRRLPLRWAYHEDARQFETPPPLNVETLIIHGLSDEVIPVERSRRYAAQYPQQATLIEVESDHSMTGILPFLSEKLIEFFALR